MIYGQTSMSKINIWTDTINNRNKWTDKFNNIKMNN